MPKSFTQVTTDHDGQMVFTSSQDSITNFLSGPMITNYAGICLALVMIWLSQDTCKKSPLKGIVNKTRALALQGSMESNWNGFSTVENQGTTVIKKHFWWKSTQMESLLTGDPDVYLQNDPKNKRDGLHIFVLYFPSGPAHGIGVWRFPTTAVVLYDPNEGACVQSSGKFKGFLTEFIKEIYPKATHFAVCSWYSDPTG